MTAEQIRAEAIEVLARERYARSRKPGSPEWGDPKPGFSWLWQTHRETAAVDVDALAAAGLLPVETQRLAAYAALDTTDEHLVERYLTDWRAVAK